MNQHSVAPASAASRKLEKAGSRESLTQLIDYVRVLIGLAAKPIWSLASYNNVVLQEEDLHNRIGVRHDLSDTDGPIYLKVDRLRRIDPPEPQADIKEWLTVGRDPFKEPIVQSLRTITASAAEVERLAATGAIDRTDVTKTLKPRPGMDVYDVVLRLSQSPDVKAKIEEYIVKAWSEWSQAERPRRETIDIYDRLFSLQQALKLEGSDKPLEIVWGVGVARWKLPPNELDHPIIEQLVELELDEGGAIFVRPRAIDPIMALTPFAAMENPGTDLVARFARDHFARLQLDREFSPFDKDTFAPILRYACAQFDRTGRYQPDHMAPNDRNVPAAGVNLVLTDTWALYARPRSENFLSADLERLREAVEADSSLPRAAHALITKPSDEQTYAPSISGMGIATGSSGSSPSINAARDAGAGSRDQYFFPKPFNDEQIAIVERLESPDVDGVVVQGPPGTGKTHTIANVICHYLATGRRVLVTSKSEGALTVLREQIPEGIRDLAISLLTSERQGLKQLEATVHLLASSISSLNTRTTEREVSEGEQRIAALQRRIAKTDAEMQGFAEQHLTRVRESADRDGILPMELAEQVMRDRDHYTWFTDRPPSGQSPNFGDEDVAAAGTARKALGPDLIYLEALLPSASDLPDSASLASIHHDLANAARIERSRQSNAPVMSLLTPNALVRADALLVPGIIVG
jgi:hypothetical protein